MKSPATRTLIALMALSLVLPASAQAPAPTPAQQENSEELQPKFIWGIVIKIALNYAMSAFTSWLAQKATTDIAPAAMERLVGNSATAVIMPLARFAFGVKSAGGAENTTTAQPTAPLTLENGKENYQGVHVALVGFDRRGQALGIQPVTAGFKSGDRIKLKVLPTFDGLLVIENINPKGERKQIYPPRDSDVVLLKAGTEVLVPLGRDQYFEFGGVTGDEQLVITVRDPRAFGTAEAKTTASRKDENSGSSFVQETTPGTYPVISQSLKLKHG